MNALLRASGLVFLAAGLAVTRGAGDVTPPAAPALDYFLVVTGGELLEGAYPDAHTHFITRTLLPFGLHCVGSLIADDRPADITAALRFATNRADLVLVTGGLGPTPNDITRETVSAFTGVPLVENEEVLAGMERRFGQFRDQLRANLRKQCLVPERGGYLKNSQGTAVGLLFSLDHATVVALPGPPRELQSMVREGLVPWLRQRYGLHALGDALTLRFVGVGQSQITQTLQDHALVPDDVVVTSLFEGSRVDFTFTSPHRGPGEVARLRRIEQGLRAELEEFFYADDERTLEQVVLRALRDRGARLAIGEVASGGALGASLNTAAEAGTVLVATFAAPTAEALARLVGAPPEPWRGVASPEERAKVLAEATAAHAGAEWAVVVGEGRSTANGAEIWLAVRSEGRQVTHRLAARTPRGGDVSGLVTAALDRLRRELRATAVSPDPPPGVFATPKRQGPE
jgi:nicotinamide-nucleotide amidase